MPQKIYHIILAIFLFCSVNALAVPKHRAAAQNSSTAITVVSDTSDNVGEDTAQVGDTTFYVNPSTTSVRIVNPDLTSGSFWKWVFGSNGPFTLFQGLGGGSFLFIVVNLILFFLIFFFPILLILLIIFLIVRDRRRKRKYGNWQQQTQAPNEAQSFKTYASQDADYEIEKSKDKAILHMAIGAGVVIFFLIFTWNLGIGIGIIFTCYGAGQFLNARRAQKRRNNQNNENKPQ